MSASCSLRRVTLPLVIEGAPGHQQDQGLIGVRLAQNPRRQKMFAPVIALHRPGPASRVPGVPDPYRPAPRGWQRSPREAAQRVPDRSRGPAAPQVGEPASRRAEHGTSDAPCELRCCAVIGRTIRARSAQGVHFLAGAAIRFAASHPSCSRGRQGPVRCGAGADGVGELSA